MRRKLTLSLALTLLVVAASVALAQIQVRVGPVASSDGTTPAARSTRSASVCVAQTGGKYKEACLRGRMFAASVGASGQAPGTAIGTTAYLTIYNPQNSGYRLVLLRCSNGYISGTLGAGTMYLVGATSTSQAAPSGGTAITPTNVDVGNPTASVALPRLGATVAAGGIALTELFSVGPELATSVEPFYTHTLDMDGSYCVEQGGRVDMQFVGGAGTTPLLSGSFVWEEVPVGGE